MQSIDGYKLLLAARAISPHEMRTYLAFDWLGPVFYQPITVAMWKHHQIIHSTFWSPHATA